MTTNNGVPKISLILFTFTFECIQPNGNSANQISNQSILDREKYLQFFYFYYQISIQQICINLPNGNWVVHKKIVNVFFFS